jgi:hypothetical protein
MQNTEVSFLDIPADIRHGIFRAIPCYIVSRYVPRQNCAQNRKISALKRPHLFRLIRFFCSCAVANKFLSIDSLSSLHTFNSTSAFASIGSNHSAPKDASKGIRPVLPPLSRLQRLRILKLSTLQYDEYSDLTLLTSLTSLAADPSQSLLTVLLSLTQLKSLDIHHYQLHEYCQLPLTWLQHLVTHGVADCTPPQLIWRSRTE